jgi:hypothetical protein
LRGKLFSALSVYVFSDLVFDRLHDAGIGLADCGERERFSHGQ